MRREFGKTICEIAENDDKIILITGDIGYGIFEEYKKRFQNRFLNLGICEQSMISVAAGLALEGLKPYIYTITPFLIERPFEQVKLDIDEQNLNVKLVGYADYPKQGPTHRMLNEKVLASMFKNIRSYFPKDNEETRRNLWESYKDENPTFISLKTYPNFKR